MRRFLIPLIALFAAAPVAAQQTQAFRSEAGYTVQLPAAWRPLPDAVVEALQQAGAQTGEGVTLEAGFRITDASFLLISGFDVGQTITLEQFVEEVTVATAQAQMQEGVELMRKDARVDAPIWDAENRILWARTQAPSTGQRAARFSWSASMLHPDGRTVVVFAVSAVTGADEARIRADLLQIFRSLRVD
ncbi:MAG TPA: hypothetical protein VEQ60_07110 [Longimicrobium sp.]|nr:hypothetical protein [Longimicrobium sp.]